MNNKRFRVLLGTQMAFQDARPGQSRPSKANYLQQTGGEPDGGGETEGTITSILKAFP